MEVLDIRNSYSTFWGSLKKMRLMEWNSDVATNHWTPFDIRSGTWFWSLYLWPTFICYTYIPVRLKNYSLTSWEEKKMMSFISKKSDLTDDSPWMTTNCNHRCIFFEIFCLFSLLKIWYEVTMLHLPGKRRLVLWLH